MIAPTNLVTFSTLEISVALLYTGCTTTMNHTPEEMSDIVMNLANGDPTGDPNPGTLAADRALCANQARRQYPIVHIDEGWIMAGSMALGAASGAAAATGTGHAGEAAALQSVGGGQRGLKTIEEIYQSVINNISWQPSALGASWLTQLKEAQIRL